MICDAEITERRKLMRASLPMYNLPEMRTANAAFWSVLRDALRQAGITDVPEAPDFDRKPVPPAIEADTLFTQVCGWPLQTIYAGQAVMLGVPVYAAPHCDGPTHAGVFVVRQRAAYATVADLRGCAFVINSIHSNSGMNLPRVVIARLARGGSFFASVTETHSQPGNLERVANGEADATCVDCVTYAFFARHRPHLAAQLRILAATPPSPAIPFVTAAATPKAVQETLRQALRTAVRTPEAGALLLTDIVEPEPAFYEVQLHHAAEAERLNYAEMK